MCELVVLEPGRKVKDWVIEKKLGEGAFGAVYRCNNGKGDRYALKVEGKNEQIQLLKMEVHVLNELGKAGGRHFCKIEDKGQVDSFNFVVMTFVGRSLQDLKALAPTKKLTLGTAMSVGIQCLEALEDLHGIGYLHRDVKPGNYTIGRPEVKELRKVYVLDFGMCRKFVHDDGTIKQPRAVAGFRGTVKYAPIACHANREQCRLDDCETWLYMLVELTRGTLPWRNMKELNDIGNAKRAVRMSELGMKQLFGGCPREYIDILRTIDGGKFFDEPNYARMYTLLRQGIKSCNVQEFPYDWEDYLMKQMEEDKKKKATGEESGKRKDKKETADEKEDEKEKKKAIADKKAAVIAAQQDSGNENSKRDAEKKAEKEKGKGKEKEKEKEDKEKEKEKEKEKDKDKEKEEKKEGGKKGE